MSDASDAVMTGNGPTELSLHRVAADAPWAWLAAGWRDMWRKPLLSLGYGLFFSALSVLIVAFMFSADWSSLALASVGGFMLMGPMLAVGLYELSRRYETGEPIEAGRIIFVATKSPTQLAYLGVTLMVILLLWIRVAMLLFALFQGAHTFPPIGDFLASLVTTDTGIGLLVTGTVIGAGMALAVFAISVVSVPLLLDQPVDVMTAIITSLKACAMNKGPLLLWAALVAGFSALGLATAMLGMIVTFPLLGHATWHAYRALVTARD